MCFALYAIELLLRWKQDGPSIGLEAETSITVLNRLTHLQRVLSAILQSL